MTFIFIKNITLKDTLIDTMTVQTRMSAVSDCSLWYENHLYKVTENDQLIESARYAFSELLLNAYEHGNLGIDHDRKHRLIEEGTYWDILEVEEEQNDKEIKIEIYKHYHQNTAYFLTIIYDQGEGFNTDILKDIFQRTHHYNGRGVFASKQNSNGIYYNMQGNSVLTIHKL